MEQLNSPNRRRNIKRVILVSLAGFILFAVVGIRWVTTSLGEFYEIHRPLHGEMWRALDQYLNGEHEHRLEILESEKYIVVIYDRRINNKIPILFYDKETRIREPRVMVYP